MKRIINSALFLVVAMTATAQNNNNAKNIDNWREGSLTTELQFNPFSNDFKTFKMGELKLRYFLDDENAVRVSVGFGMDNQTVTNTTDFDNRVYNPNNYRISSEESEVTTKSIAAKIKIGYERHIDLLDRLSVYVGGEVGYEANFYSGEKNVNTNSQSYSSNERSWTDYSERPYTTKYYQIIQESRSSSTGHYNYEKCTPDDGNSNSHSIIANVFTGIDFQIYKGLYIGTELGLSFKMGKNEKGSYNYEIRSNSNYSTRYSGSYPSDYKNESSSYSSYERFDSSTGIRESSSASSGSSSQSDPSYSAAEVRGNTSKFTKISLYVEPALRIGWRF